LPSQFIDLVAVVTIAAMVVVLVDRINKPVKRYLSTFEDWFTWLVTFLPVLTGWMAVQHLLLPYTTMLALHILSGGNCCSSSCRSPSCSMPSPCGVRAGTTVKSTVIKE
jgi:hypothetical protein